MENPTDPNAGTNRTNAVSRDNLMNGVSLGYSGNYSSKALNVVGIDGHWQSSTISNTDYSYNLRITTEGTVNPQNRGNKFIGRSVRRLLSPLVALV
ncbi:hypothetical protein IKG12_02465 [Candidatus Saccharibacteria bacterium]|nr:hypothetical protein [Candidatus Saccharibacteria bacterium]